MLRLLFPVILVVGLFYGCAGRTYKIVTPTMSPTLKVGDVRHATKVGKDAELKRFDIVVFKLPEEIRQELGDAPGSEIISRIIGLPGEKVEVKDGIVYVNDELLAERFDVTPDKLRSAPPIVVPQNEYYLLGDNRPESADSRHWKKPTILRSDISGKIEGIE